MMLLIDLGKPHKLPVGSRTSSLPLVTVVIFCKIVKFLKVYIRTVHLTTNELFFLSIRKATCVLELISSEYTLLVLL